MANASPGTGIFNGSEFIVLTINEEFETAARACENLEPTSLAASFSSVEEYTFVLSLIDEVQTIPEIPNMFWIGLNRGEDEEGVLAADFFFLDGNVNVFVEDEEFPWAPGEPDNVQPNQQCSNIDRGNSNTESRENRLIDQNCDGREERTEGGIVCRRAEVVVINEEEEDDTLVIVLFSLTGILVVVFFFQAVLKLSKRRRKRNFLSFVEYKTFDRKALDA